MKTFEFNFPEEASPEWTLEDRDRYVALLAEHQVMSRLIFSRLDAKELVKSCKSLDELYFVAYTLGVYDFESIMETTQPDEKGKKAINFIKNVQAESIKLYGETK